MTEPICDWAETWYKTKCPLCGQWNWACDGDVTDFSAVDIEAVECYFCDKRYWLAEPLIDDHALLDAVCAKGRDTP